MNSYRGKSVLKKAAMNVLVKHLQPDQINQLKKEFEKYDQDCSGFLELHELSDAIKNADFEMSEEEI